MDAARRQREPIWAGDKTLNDRQGLIIYCARRAECTVPYVLLPVGCLKAILYARQDEQRRMFWRFRLL